MEVTADDLHGLDGEAFDAVWTALGLIFREREPRPAVDILATESPQSLHSTPAAPTAVADPTSEAEVVAALPKPRATVPLSAMTVVCEPGCGQAIPQAVIGAHRRDCEAVLAFKVARGVRVVPSLATAAPLPEAPASDFDARRKAAAQEASERSWRETHADMERAGLTAGEVRRAEAAKPPLSAAGVNRKDAERVLATGFKRTPEQRERMRRAQVDSRIRRGLPVNGASA